MKMVLQEIFGTISPEQSDSSKVIIRENKAGGKAFSL
jgi:hypothetical protein